MPVQMYLFSAKYYFDTGTSETIEILQKLIKTIFVFLHEFSILKVEMINEIKKRTAQRNIFLYIHLRKIYFSNN